MSSLWHYVAVDEHDPSRRRTGELAGETAAEVRAALRRIGLQVIELKPRKAPRKRNQQHTGNFWSVICNTAIEKTHSTMRQRRRMAIADLYDGLATLLSSGVPLLEAVQTTIDAIRAKRSALRWMLIDVREQLRDGASLAAAMARHPGWFDTVEIAMVRAGQHAGTLPDVLTNLAARHQRRDALTGKLTSALIYPAIVACVGLGVVVFLSVNTLPKLTQILTDADLAVPPLTQWVMTFGQVLAEWWPLLLGALIIGMGLSILALEWLAQRSPHWNRMMQRCVPRVLRRLAVARLAAQLSELLSSGVPMVDALRVLAPTVSSRALRGQLQQAADAIERGESLPGAMHDDRWFDAEFRRLLDIGQSTGELDVLLQRLAQRTTRRAERLIDRLAAVLEPAVIIVLATLIGVVVMAAVLPLIRLQEVL